MDDSKNIDSSEQANKKTKSNISWRTLKVHEEIRNAFDEIKETLESKHGKPMHNNDVMRFLLYLAKIALELEENSELDGVSEPLDYDVLMKLERYSQSIANSFGIPVKYVRGGVLWGILEVANEAIQKGWKKGKYYLELAQSWIGEYSFYLYEEEVSKTIESLIKNIPWTEQSNPRRGEIHERLFENVENLVALIFPRPNAQILNALVLNEIHVRKWDRALNIMKRALSYGNFNNEKIIGLVEDFIKKAGRELDPEILEDYVRHLLGSAESLRTELRIVEIASTFIDVRPLYNKILKRKYLLPEDRLEVSMSMILSASKTGDKSLLDIALSVAKKELGTLRESASPDFEFQRERISETLGMAGFWDSIIKLKFEDEVPWVGYYRLMTLSALRKDFGSGWAWFERLVRVICNEKYTIGASYYRLFLPNGPDGVEKWLSNCFKDMDAPGNIFKNLLLLTSGSIADLKITGLHISCKNPPRDILNISIGEEHEIIPRGVILKLIAQLLMSGAIVNSPENKVMLAKLLSEENEYLEIAKNLVEEALNEMSASTVAYHLGSPGFVKLLKDVGINPLETLEKALSGLSEKGHAHYLSILKTFIASLIFEADGEDEINEVFELIEKEKLLDVLAGVIKDSSLRHRLGLLNLKRLKQDLVDYFVEAYMERMGYALTAEFILGKKLKTSQLPYLVDGLLSEGNIEMADKLASEFGLGWFGVGRIGQKNTLEILLKYRFEKCIYSFKIFRAEKDDNSRGKNVEVPECYKAALTLLRASRRYLKPEEYNPLAGKYAGRLLVWRVVKTERE